jgi:UDP-3-O-[3-hydroxymyristoyl] glucosamine N-acyltransferase
MKLSEIPVRFQLEIVRDAEFDSLGFASHSHPRMLVFLESEKYLPLVLGNAEISAVITTPELLAKVPAAVGAAVTRLPRFAFYSFHNHLARETDFYWRSFDTEIASSARVHPRAFVAEKNVKIGERCVIEPNATILERVIIEDDVVIRANTVVGSEGFQFIPHDGHLMAIAHGGGVRLERGVELQASNTVDRCLFGGFTVVGEETKTDNRVHIAHDCKLGKRNRLAAAAMLAGSVRTGDDVWIGPSTAISSEVTIGEKASITIGAVVTRNVPPGARVSGNFAVDHDRFLAHIKAIR